ncbi:MAG: hypothetical protein R3245_02070 [Kiloniellales bacterium]|nr:hypothetical protein [Kiloniellales bacterium]
MPEDQKRYWVAAQGLQAAAQGLQAAAQGLQAAAQGLQAAAQGLQAAAQGLQAAAQGLHVAIWIFPASEFAATAGMAAALVRATAVLKTIAASFRLLRVFISCSPVSFQHRLAELTQVGINHKIFT